MSNQTNSSNPVALEAEQHLGGSIASPAEIKDSADFTSSIWNAFVTGAAQSSAGSITTFVNQLKKLADETGWPYESITAYRAANPSYVSWAPTAGNQVLFSATSDISKKGWLYVGYLTFPAK